MAEEHAGMTDGTEDERIPWVVQQHIGIETTRESYKEEVCRWELDNYLDYVWRPAAHERRVSGKQLWWRREYLWP